MKFDFIQLPSLPVLAWCAKIQKVDSHVVTVFHGDGIETRADAFVEGAWDGEFAPFKFIESTVMSGTGGRIGTACVRFTGSTDRLNPLFSLDTPQALYVSNSLMFVMAAAGEELNPIYPYYAYDLVRIWRQGLFCTNGSLPLLSGKRLRLHFAAILRVGANGIMTLERHQHGDAPADYERYKSVLEDRVKRLLANAEAPERKLRFRSLSALSRGYDSSAMTVLAREGGCREVVTLLDSRETDPELDSGLINARRLGMECREVDRWSFTARNATPIAELSMFAISCDAPVAGFEDLLRGRIYITGQFGDTIWDPVKSRVCDQFSQTWARFASGINKLEFRLRVGFLTFAPSSILALHNHAIHRITHSKEMQPWSVPGDYNRPIARRIIEEAGLPRGSFAMLKRGGGHSHFRVKAKDFSPAMESYREFLAHNDKRVPFLSHRAWRTRVKTDQLLWRYLGAEKKFVPSTPLQRRFPFFVNCTPIKLEWPAMFTLQWAQSLVSPRYRVPDEKSGGG